MKCSDCLRQYHLGKKCSGVADGTFKAMSTTKQEKWRCPACRDGSSNPNPTLNCDTQSSQTECTEFGTQLSTLHQKLDLLLSWKASVDNLQDLHPKIDALLSMKLAVDALRDSVTEMQESVAFISAQYDSLVNSTKSQDQAVKELQAENRSLHSKISDQALEYQQLKATQNDQAEEIQQLKAAQNSTDQSNRQSFLEIHGIPFSSKENLNGILTDLAGQLNIDSFQLTHVEAAHRLPARHDAIPPILVHFSSVALKERWMACRGRLRSLPHEESQPRIYFNDHLTDANKKLFWMARTKGKEKGYKFVWVRHGQIFARHDVNSAVLRITNAAALEQIV